MIATGGTALRSMVWPSEPSVATSSSWTILTTIWPGVTDLTTVAPIACSRTRSVKLLTTSSETSASSSARRTSRIAASTSASRTANRAPSADRECHQAFPTDCRTMPLSCLSSPLAGIRPRSGVSSTPSPSHQRCRALVLRFARSRAGGLETIFQTLLRPRAHRAVGRWPPASRAGRRVEKNVFPRVRRVKRPAEPKVKESRPWRGVRSVMILLRGSESAAHAIRRPCRHIRRMSCDAQSAPCPSPAAVFLECSPAPPRPSACRRSGFPHENL